MRRLTYFTLIVLLIFAGCDWDSNGHNVYVLEAEETYNWSAADFQELAVLTENGDITAGAVFSSEIMVTVTRRVLGPDEAELEALLDSILVDTSSLNAQLTINASMPDGGSYEYNADFTILAPPDLALVLNTVNGNVSADGFSAGTSFSTVNGNVTVENHSGSVHLQAVNGSLNCDLASLETQELALLITTNGDVVLRLPPDVSAGFSASTTNGTVEILGFDSITYVEYQPALKTGDIGTGDASINVITVNGDVTIQPRD